MPIPDTTIRFRLCVLALIAVSCAACDKRPVAPVLPAGQSPGDVIRGKSLLAQYQCGACHVIPDVPFARGIAGPPLGDFGRRSYIAGHIPNNAELLAQWIVEPRSLVPNTTMPSMGVSTDDARDMAAYLHTLR
jgi:cytochrome c